MAGWNGAGTFSRLYNWVTDAANGIKILASKMDDEFNGLVTGLNNVLCKDGQNSPTADINWNNKKITNLAAGVAATDAARVGQLSQEWTPETRSLTFVSATSFKVMGADVTATYHAYRRVKTTNTGGTVYSTIVSSSYSAPDTTVVVTNDSGTVDAGLSAASYGISYLNPSYLNPRSLVYATGSDGVALNTGATRLVPFSTGTEPIDFLSEFNPATAKFTAKYAGFYYVQAIIAFTVTSSTTTWVQVQVTRNSSAGWFLVNDYRSWVVYSSGQIYSIPTGGVIQLNVGDTLELSISTGVNLLSSNLTGLTIMRLL